MREGLMAERDTLKGEVEAVAEQGFREPYLLYSMGLRLNTLDYETLETDCLVDGREDKKIDFFNLDLENGTATIAQGYFSEDWNKPQPPSNKAADLGVALNWLLESDLTAIPRESIRAAAKELREGLESGEISRLEVFYVHNLTPSSNVDAELGTVKRSAERLLERYSGDHGLPPECMVRQVSRNLVDEWRRSQHDAVSIDDEIVLTSSTPPQLQDTPEWRAITANVPVADIVHLRTKYGDALFSANVRDYLGSRQTSRNINRQIELTVEREPENFWVYNNGITLLTKGFSHDDVTVRIQGIAVINGAQTTGSLAQAAATGKVDLEKAKVLVRIIKCNDPGVSQFWAGSGVVIG